MEEKIYQEEVVEAPAEQRFFCLKTANQWIREAMTMPPQKRLFGDFWFEDEVCVMFAETNAGKSILAVQIADSISRGADIYPLRNETDAQPVLYFDFELEMRQFCARYSLDGAEPYIFSDNFIRVNRDFDSILPCGDHCEYICEQIERSMIQAGAKVGILDNITFLGDELEKSAGALPLMKKLKEIKQRGGFSFLVLAHCPKRSSCQEITKNDIQGSSMILNFADSAFSIGLSRQGSDVRYLKQQKVRNTSFTYTRYNVLTARLTKDYNKMVFTFTGTSQEAEHLDKPVPVDKEQKMTEVGEMFNDDKSAREIARELNLSHTTVLRYLKELRQNGRISTGGTGTGEDVPDVPSVPDVPPCSTDVPAASSKPKRKKKPEK